MPTAREILRELQARDGLDPKEHPEAQTTGMVVLLDASPLLQRLVACWQNVPVPRDPQPDEEIPPDTPPSHYTRWLWARYEPDPIPMWLAMAGLPDAPHTRRWCEVALQNALVFPDGTVSKWVRQYLSTKAADIMGVVIPRPQPRPEAG